MKLHDSARIPFVTSGTSGWRIVIPANASETVARSATVCSETITEMSGAVLPIMDDRQPVHDHEITIGTTSRPAFDELVGDQECRIRITESRIHLAGGSDLGTMYAVYGFLEQNLGCRWLTSTVHHFPEKATIDLHPCDVVDKPDFSYREVFYRDAWHRDFAEPNRINGQGAETLDEMLSEIHIGWGTWCHTFAGHVPPEDYFEDHPEYFALVDGNRIPDGQLCLTNETVFDLVVKDLQKRMAEKPEAVYWSVSQNDCIKNCSCEACSRIDTAEESPMGSLLTFVNRVAAEFPEKIISTLAYQYSRKPPKTVRPAENVHIMLCNIECIRSLPIEIDPASAPFREDLVAWAQITENLFIWDYVIQFSHLVSPFPNFNTLAPNVQFFSENHVRGIFSQGNREIGGEFSELRAYILAKLSWDVSFDVAQGIREFLDLYYGAGGAAIGKYIDLIHKGLARSDTHLRIFGGPEDASSSYLSTDLIETYNGFFNEAEEAVGDNPELLMRVRTARLPLQYAMLRTEFGDPSTRRKVLDDFAAVSAATGLEKVEEWKYTVTEFVDDMKKALE